MLSIKLIPAKDFQDENDPNKLQDQIIQIVRCLQGSQCLELGLPLNSRENILRNISQLYTIVSEEMILEEVSSGER